jgi:hypothetical protein
MLEKSARDLLTQISELAGHLGHEAERPHHELEIAALFDRCRSTFGAIRLLIGNDFVHEAVMLARPLFTDSLVLAELAASGEARRIELVVGRTLKSYYQIEKLVGKMAAGGDDVAEELRHLAERRRRAERYARYHGVGTSHWEPNEKNLADVHDRSGEYLDFQITHHFVHGTAAATEQRYSPGAGDEVAVGGPAVDLERWALPTALFAAYSMLLACRHTCRILGLPEPKELDSLFSEVERRRPEVSPPPK